MIYRIHEVKINIGEDKNYLPEKIEKRFSKEGKSFKIKEWRIVRESIDARDKQKIKFVYTVDFIPDREIQLPLEEAEVVRYEVPLFTGKVPVKRPIVCGFGPSGIFAALILAEAGLQPIVYERGRRVDQRVADVNAFWQQGKLNEESNVQFGEGGAGTFSDGKLTTGNKDRRMRKVLEEFYQAGADEEILYKQKPHIGTDKLRDIVVTLRKKIESLGGELYFDSKLTGLESNKGKIAAIEVNGSQPVDCSALVLSIGHSARDTFRMLHAGGVLMEQKPFSIGLRIEHPQTLINKAQYGANWGNMQLPPAEYKLAYRCKTGRGVYTFCMCPGGEVIVSSSEQGGLVINGMSYHARNAAMANSAVLVDVKVTDFADDHPLSGIAFQEKYEQLAYQNAGMTYTPPQTTWQAFAKDEAAALAVIDSLPEFAAASIKEAIPVFGRKLKGFDASEAILKAVETRSSSPVRIVRDSSFNSNIKGLYPAGEGAGYAGGIMSSAVDGIKVAEAIIKEYNDCK